jgi:AsmA protein
MKKILIGLGVLVVLIIVLALVVPALIPLDTYKAQALAGIEQATGRKARIDGEFSFSVLPTFRFTAGKVGLANAPGAQPAEMVTLDTLTIRVALFPLLRGHVVVDAFVLEKPVISLSVDRNGRPNWQFDTPPARPGEAPPTTGGGPGLGGLTLGDVRIVDGRIAYADARSGARYDIDDVDMKVALPSLSSPMKADGSLVWNKEKVTLTLDVENPEALLGGRPTGLAARVTSSHITVGLKGTASSAGVMKASGALDLDVPSVRKLAAWAGRPVDMPGSGLGPLKITGLVEVDGPRAAFRDARIALDAIKGAGEFRFDSGGPRPYAGGKLALETVDLNPYLPPPAPADKDAGAKPAPGSPPARSQEWSDDPIDLSPLRQADADFDLTVAALIARKIKIGKSHVGVTLKNGRLVADLTEMALYGGGGKARITADASERLPALALRFGLDGVDARPLLTDAMDLDRIEGKANAALETQGRGLSQRQIISSLEGAGRVQFLDGAVRGLNLAAMVRNISTAFLDAEARKEQKTDFAELSGTYTIRSGIVTNTDMALKSPILRVTGKGTVDLPQRRVSYRVEPKAVATTQGQGGPADVAGITVPVIVEGPWDNLSYRPDLAGAVGSATKGKAIEELEKRVPGAGDLGKRLFGR